MKQLGYAHPSGILEEAPLAPSLVARCQHQLGTALKARVRATEAAVGARFAFEVVERGATTAVFAHRWPRAPHQLPFSRIFDFRPSQGTSADPLLDRIVAEQIDVVIELLPGDDAAAAAALLRAYGFQPVWQIPWYGLPLTEPDVTPIVTAQVEQLAPADLGAFAELLCDGYGYQSPERDAWQALAHYGYQAPGFVCFRALLDQQAAAAGVLFSDGATALVDGASTRASFRGRGLQQALLAVRLAHARRLGASYAFSRTGAGSISETNLVKLGMRLLVASTAWRRH